MTGPRTPGRGPGRPEPGRPEPGRPEPGRPEQLPLAFDHDAASGRDDLLVADPLSAAVAIVDAWPAWPSPVVVIAGPAGSGKSHLANIWRQRAQAIGFDARTGGDPAVAARGPVLVEDADRAGIDDRTLFHLINSVREHGSSLLMTARLMPLSWGVTLPDLRSRLKAATVVEIGRPDEVLLAQVLVKLFSDRQLQIDDRVIDYVVSRMERSTATALTIVDRLDRLALSRGRRITRALAAEVLSELPGDPSD